MKFRAFLLLLAALAAGAVAAARWVRAPYRGFSGEVFVDIPKGTGSAKIARMLSGAGVIRHPVQFLILRALRPGARLQAGEYRFAEPASAWQVFDRLVCGDIFYYVLAVPEGNNIFDIAAALTREGIMDGKSFLVAAHDPSLIRDLAPQAPSLEGYLFPDTYHLTRHTTPAQLCKMMTDRFRKVWSELAPPDAAVHDTVTLASLVEKEARLPGERALIASVFLNRLRLRMPLQCDPTAIYAALLEDRYRGAIYRSDLDSKQRFNTYQHAGLPPGPIANPGAESLRAALNPAETEFLYFVALPGNSGAHQFSKELAQHARAVQQYRRGLRQTKQADRTERVPGRKTSRKNH
ncbi:MAG: endolytic transglycosylase MltG [Rhodospirillales bacterium]